MRIPLVIWAFVIDSDFGHSVFVIQIGGFMFYGIAEAVSTGLPDLAGLGSAGLMGAMWLWERRANRTREQQLDEAHQQIGADRVQLEQVFTVVRQNTEALTRLCTLIEKK